MHAEALGSRSSLIEGYSNLVLGTLGLIIPFIPQSKSRTPPSCFHRVSFLCNHVLILRRYFSPYPLTESEAEDAGVPNAQAPHAAAKIPGVARSSIRSHGRTSDLFAGGLGRSHGVGQNSTLWVCDRCFKYMAEGQAWELHVVRRPVSLITFLLS